MSSLLDLPIELIDEILLESFRQRGFRGLRLRLVNKLFAAEVWKLAVRHSLMDMYFQPKYLRPKNEFAECHFLRSELGGETLLSLYTEQRVLMEPLRDGRPGLLKIRDLAKRISIEPGHTTKMIGSASQSSRPAPGERLFNISNQLSLSNPYGTYDKHELLCAAILALHTPLVDRLIEEHKDLDLYHDGKLFRSPMYHALQIEETKFIIKYFNIKDFSKLGDLIAEHFPESESYQVLLHYIKWVFSRTIQDPDTAKLNWDDWLNRPMYLNPPIFEFVKGTWGMEYVPFSPSSLGRFQYERSLQLAARDGNEMSVGRVLELGLFRDDLEMLVDPLRLACRYKETRTVAVLLDAGANPQDGLMEATRWCNEKVVALLLSRGATVVGKKGVLTHPARLGRESLVKLLLDHGADMFEGDPDPFVSAIFLEHTSLFRLMMEKKGVLSKEVGRQCLRKAQEDGLESMIELLREYGVNADEVSIDE